MSELAIDVRNLSKKFGDRLVVNNINLQVPKGKIYGFLGPNGSGKTTTIRMLCGLLTPSSGEGKCLGLDLMKETLAIRERVGYMTQKFSFWEDMTIYENLEFTANIYKMRDVENLVANTIAKLGLQSRQNQLAGALSGGWKQRLALAACILHKPDILLLDEPTAGVDPNARREFWDELGRLSEEGMTILVSTHYMDEAERCHELVYIAQGNLIVQGAVEAVIAKTQLKTLEVSGIALPALQKQLEQESQITTMSLFGGVLRVCGREEQSLICALKPYQELYNLVWRSSNTSLEDAFIYYLQASKDAQCAIPTKD